MRVAQADHVFFAQVIPRRVRHGDERAGCQRALRNFRAGLIRQRLREIEWQPVGEDMPQFARARFACVQFRPVQGDELRRVVSRWLGVRIVVVFQKVLGDSQEVVT
ncbi:MAG: hypothetical protein IPK17_39390, partial [Chloroflexi bacterium]|uniref:hypothetical protein n=1 Tax=Candidatus Flexifilum breve TaxID=3140694 RepID=UPI003134F9F1|nr:hypothetical protein [Chloroflexota bacterium]